MCFLSSFLPFVYLGAGCPAMGSLQREGDAEDRPLFGASKLRGSSNNTSEAIRKQNRRTKYSIEWFTFEEMQELQGQVEPMGVSEDRQDSEAK